MTHSSSQEKILREQIEDSEPSECECCGWQTDKLKPYSARFNEPDMLLCEVCGSTPIGNSALFPTNARSISEVLQSIAWGVNYLKEKDLSHTLSDRKAKLKEEVEEELKKIRLDLESEPDAKRNNSEHIIERIRDFIETL